MTLFFASVLVSVGRDENCAGQSQEVMEQVKLLKAQISELEARERELDTQRALLEEGVQFHDHDPLARTYPFFFLFFKRCIGVTAFYFSTPVDHFANWITQHLQCSLQS